MDDSAKRIVERGSDSFGSVFEESGNSRVWEFSARRGLFAVRRSEGHCRNETGDPREGRGQAQRGLAESRERTGADGALLLLIVIADHQDGNVGGCRVRPHGPHE